MTDQAAVKGFEVCTIVSPSGKTRASFVPEKGGIGSSLIMMGPQGPRELLYQHDFFWDKGPVERIPGGWPYLFPVCGRLERGGVMGPYLYEGRLYRLPSHGFGPRMPWKAVFENSSEVVLSLSATAATREVYPFSFEVDLRYRAEDDAFICEQTYRNAGMRPLPYYGGFHPYFATPAPGQGKEEILLDYHPIRRLIYNEKLSDVIGEGTLPQMPISIAEPRINELLTVVGADKETRLVYPDGMTLHMTAEGVEDPDLFPYIQLYTMPEKPFFCIEPWMGFPNALNTVSGVRWLMPGQEEKGLLKVWLTF
ncbi:MAG: aldose epimerase [Lentisphaerae bacterium GWF2_57_35]|nr:MAG: aldose epimerase [Lentisphaerae bacterium GWF2_57_35]